MLFPSCKTTVLIILLIISITVTIVSVILTIFIFPNLIATGLHESLMLKNGTTQYDYFIEVPFPITFNVYLFNVENPEDVLHGERPILREVGPYVYKKYVTRIVEDTDDEEDTISFREKFRFEFDQYASGNLSVEDNVTVVNYIMNSMLQAGEISMLKSFIYGCIPKVLQSISTPFITVRVKDLLFDGPRFCSKHHFMCNILCNVAQKDINIVKTQDGSLRAPLFSSKNRSNTVFTMKRGIKEVDSLGQIVKVNNSRYLNVWDQLGPESPCDDVEGAYYFLFPPGINKIFSMKIFSSDFCRSLPIKFLKEDVYNGIKGYMFSNSFVLQSTFKNKSEDCFCSKLTRNFNGEESCYLDGLLDLKPCVGQSVLLSGPHFFEADPGYLQGVVGLSPNEEIHKSFMTIIPEVGIPLRGYNRIQINTVLRPYKYKAVMNISRGVLPIFWVDEGCVLPDEFVDQIQNIYFNKVLMIHVIQWILLGGGIFSTVICAGYFVSMKYF